MYMLDLEKAVEPEIKLSASFGSKKSKGIFLKIYFCFIGYDKVFDCVDYNKLWKILKVMEIPDHNTCLLRNCKKVKKAIVRTVHKTTDWCKIGKGVSQGFILSSCLFKLYAEYLRCMYSRLYAKCWAG